MHIPDGYLSPSTCAVGYAVAVPFWYVASRRVTRVVKTRNVPFLALLAALSFIIMMFNVPIPDGTTAHAVGGSLIAIVLGPWAAVIAVTVALTFQALLFGDGGVLALGANVVNMAIVLPFVGYAVYRLVAGRAPLTARRRVIAAAVAGYASINAAALAAAIEFGIQPGLFQTASGAPLYSPYDLAQAIPAMMIPHLTVAGFCEAALSAAVLAYLQRADPARLCANHPGIPTRASLTSPRPRKAWSPARVAAVGMAVLVVLTPLGLLAPGGAFGEDAPADLDIGGLGLSTVPSGLAKYNGFWNHAILGDYGFGGEHANLAYIVSAIVGIIVVGAAIFALTALVRWLTGRAGGDSNEGGDGAGDGAPDDRDLQGADAR